MDTKNYVLGRGKLFFDPFAPAPAPAPVSVISVTPPSST